MGGAAVSFTQMKNIDFHWKINIFSMKINGFIFIKPKQQNKSLNAIEYVFVKFVFMFFGYFQFAASVRSKVQTFWVGHNV